MEYITKKEIQILDGYFRAANYLSVAQLYLMDNPLLRTPLKITDVKPNPVGHFGTVPGQNFIYVHLNRIIAKYNLNMIYISGPGHGAQAMIANNYLEGTYSRYYPEFSQDINGMKLLFRRFAAPHGVSSHVEANVPGSIHTGGELGYSLAHAAGAVLDNSSLIAACVVGDGEAETGPLATSWNINKFLNKKTDGVVLPILHRNGFKISNPTVFGRMSEKEIEKFFTSLGWKPYFVTGKDELVMHEKMARVMDTIVKEIGKIKKTGNGNYPVLILTTPKGWTCPKIVDNKEIESSFRSHQVPVSISRLDTHNLPILEKWLRSYHPEELFDENGKLKKIYREYIPTSSKRMGMNPIANGGNLKNLICPILKPYEVDVVKPGSVVKQDMIELSAYIRDLFTLNKNSNNFRIFGPDEAMSNRLYHIFEAEKRTWNFRMLKNDEFLSNNGRIMDSYLSEHLCEGMLEGYILTGRYGIIHSYEAFAKVIESMMSQHTKWLKIANETPWRKSIPSLNFLLTSHTFQQDHNGYTHQEPSFVNALLNKKSNLVGAYYPVDTNTLLVTFDKVIKTRGLVNLIVASKHPRPQWFNMTAARELVNLGIGVVPFASNDDGNPDVVLVGIGETPFLEVLGAVDILRKGIPKLKIRVIAVNDLLKLSREYSSGLSDEVYNNLFTKDRLVVFNFHGYDSVIKDLIFERFNKNISIHGYKEEGCITTPFDMRVQNEIDRFHLVKDIINRLPNYQVIAKPLVDWCDVMLRDHDKYISLYDDDMPYIKNWQWK